MTSPWLAVLGLALAGSAAAQEWRGLDDFTDPAAWTTHASDQVGAVARAADGPDGQRALCLDYDFHGVSGYAVLRRELPTAHPAHFEYAFALRGDAPLNNFEIKLPDASGDNVWWVNRPNWPVPREWTQVRLKERHFAFAWGPTSDKVLRDTQAFELTISAGREGGQGSVCLADLRFRERAAPSATPPPLRATAADGRAVPDVVDRDASTRWEATDGGWPLVVDLGESREFGGLVLDWDPVLLVEEPGLTFDYRVETSEDGRTWRVARDVVGSDASTTRDRLALPESEARWLRVSPRGDDVVPALRDIATKPLAWAATPTAFVESLAADDPRGTWPRGFHGEQPAWTLVGIDGGTEQGLLGEDGAIEVARGGFSLEPVILSDGPKTWADHVVSQSLQDDYLPIPSVHWRGGRVDLDVAAFARGDAGASQLYGTYRLTNREAARRIVHFAIVARPLQVNGPRQFLTTPGGVSPIHAIAASGDRLAVDGRPPVRLLGRADAWSAATFDGGGALRAFQSTRDAAVDDPTGLASGAWYFEVELGPGESREIAWVAPLTGDLPATVPDAATARAEVVAQWREKLNHATFVVPPEGRRIVDTLRTALAHMLVSRVGPRLQPGTRSYARAWIRDGAMIGEGLLRLGRADVAAEFVGSSRVDLQACKLEYSIVSPK